MANKTITMQKIKQVLRLHHEGYGSKKICSLTAVSRNTVRRYLAQFKSSGLCFEDFVGYSDQQVSDLFMAESARVIPSGSRQEVLNGLLPDISKALKQKGMTVIRQWDKYIVKHPDGYQRSQFQAYISLYHKTGSLTMHFEHQAGDKVFIDYCGDKLEIVDVQSGELRKVEVFVAILGCSQLTYVRAMLTQTKEDLIAGCIGAFEYFGGVPKAVVPDNLKAAVTKSSKYAPVINETFESFAGHYSTVVLPARAYRPRDKSLVEGAVKLVYQRIYSIIKEKVYTSLESLNQAIAAALEDYNAFPLKGGDSRAVRYREEEEQYLIPLPDLPYELRRICLCTVTRNGHVCLAADKHYYSVPYAYLGKKVKILYSQAAIEIFFKYEKIASHSRDFRKYRYTTDKAHLASHHQFVTEWSSEYFIGQGNALSAEVGAYIEKLIDGKPHPEQGYKSSAGILHLGRRVGAIRLTLACKRAMEYGVYNYPIIEDILTKRLEQTPVDAIEAEHKPIPEHPNIRGKGYFN